MLFGISSRRERERGGMLVDVVFYGANDCFRNICYSRTLTSLGFLAADPLVSRIIPLQIRFQRHALVTLFKIDAGSIFYFVSFIIIVYLSALASAKRQRTTKARLIDSYVSFRHMFYFVWFGVLRGSVPVRSYLPRGKALIVGSAWALRLGCFVGQGMHLSLYIFCFIFSTHFFHSHLSHSTVSQSVSLCYSRASQKRKKETIYEKGR